MGRRGMYIGGNDSLGICLKMARTRHGAVTFVLCGHRQLFQFVNYQLYVPPQIPPHAAPAVVTGRFR